jgi:hypothetical protein
MANNTQGIRLRNNLIAAGLVAAVGLGAYTAYQVSGNNSNTQTTTNQTEQTQSDSLSTIISDGEGNTVNFNFGHGNHFHEPIEVNQLYVEEKTYLISDSLVNKIYDSISRATQPVQQESKTWLEGIVDAFQDLYCFECPGEQAQQAPVNNYKPPGNVNKKPAVTAPVDTVAPRYIPPMPENVKVNTTQRTYGLGDYSPNCK